MIRLSFRAIAALAFAGSALLPAFAFATPTLRAEALVTSEIVTVGDLIDGADGLEGVALFRAPDPGQTGPVSAAVAIAAAKRAGVSGVEAGDVSQIFVTRASREVKQVELNSLILARAAIEFGVDVEAVDVTLDGDGSSLHLEPTAKGPLHISRFLSDPKSGRFEATIDVSGQPANKPLRVTGTAIETVEAAVLTRAFARGDIVAKADVKAERIAKTLARDTVLVADALGLAAKRAIREGEPLKSADLMRPQHVDRGSTVTLIYLADGVSLSLKAKAMSAGAAGDLIPVQNIQSKRVVNGVVTGPSQVTVTAGATAVARR